MEFIPVGMLIFTSSRVFNLVNIITQIMELDTDDKHKFMSGFSSRHCAGLTGCGGKKEGIPVGVCDSLSSMDSSFSFPLL
jgi:hypothetical protein